MSARLLDAAEVAKRLAVPTTWVYRAVREGLLPLGAELFNRLGGFENEFTRDGVYGNEDLDFEQRLVAAGCRVVFNPRAVSRRRCAVSPRAHLRQWRESGRSAVLLARRHPDQTAALAARPRETRIDHLLRPVRVPVRESALLLVRIFPRGFIPGQWFFLARKLEYFRGIRDAGGWPGRYPVRVLCYHAVSDLTGARVMERYGVPPELLDLQLRFLARRFRFLTAEEFVRFLDGAGVPRRSVLLTFDDCFQDLVDSGLPILRRHRAPALAFAVTQRLGCTNEWNLESDAAQLQLADAAGLAALAEGGVAVASHTRTHPMLDQVSAAELESELRGSLADLESLGIGALPLIAYPHGAFDGEVTRSTQSAGYVAGFTVQTSLVRPGHNRFEIPRLEIFPTDGPIRFRWKLLWAGRSLRRLLSRPGR